MFKIVDNFLIELYTDYNTFKLRSQHIELINWHWSIPWKATGGMLPMEGFTEGTALTTNGSLGNYLPSMLCVVKLPNSVNYS